MKNLLALLLLSQLLMAQTCTKDDEVICTMEAHAGLLVTVSLESGAIPTPDGITVTAVDGDFTEILMIIDADKADFFGVFERPGTYIITVSKAGHTTITSEPISVTADECHVIGEKVNVILDEV